MSCITITGLAKLMDWKLHEPEKLPADWKETAKAYLKIKQAMLELAKKEYDRQDEQYSDAIHMAATMGVLDE